MNNGTDHFEVMLDMVDNGGAELFQISQTIANNIILRSQFVTGCGSWMVENE